MDSRFNSTVPDRTLPFGWWGHRSSPERPFTIIDLLRGGNLDARTAAFLWMAIERRASFVVASTLEDAGKTTLLTALLDFLPPNIQTLYLRGWYERFDFRKTHDPASTYLLCNEISDNLPTYMWGQGVRRLFEVAGEGFPFATTLHARSAHEMIGLLTSFPLEVPQNLVDQIDLVLALDGGSRSSNFIRRLMRVELINSDVEGVRAETIVERDVLQGPLVSRPGRLIGVLSDRFGIDRNDATSELARREQFLERLQRDGLPKDGSLAQAIRQFRGRS